MKVGRSCRWAILVASTLQGCATDEQSQPEPSRGGAGAAGAPIAGGGNGGGGTGGASAAGGGGTAGATAEAGKSAAAGSSGAAGAAACDTTSGKALSFKNDKIDLLAGDLGADLPGGNGPRTIELWARFVSDKSWTPEHSIMELGRRKDAANQVFGIDLNGRDNLLGNFDPYTNGAGDNAGTLVSVPVEGWCHLAWGYDGAGHFQFVVNGVKATIPKPGDGSAVLATTPGILTLGGSQSFGLEGWEGALDEVRVWSVLRTEEEIRRDMRIKLRGSEPGLIAYYNLDEGAGTTADDIKRKVGHKLSFCTAGNGLGGPCPSPNNAPPAWIDSDIPGPFSCAP